MSLRTKSTPLPWKPPPYDETDFTPEQPCGLCGRSCFPVMLLRDVDLETGKDRALLCPTCYPRVQAPRGGTQVLRYIAIWAIKNARLSPSD